MLFLNGNRSVNMCRESYKHYKKICDTEPRYAILDMKGDVLIRGITYENAEHLVESIKKVYKRELTIVEEEELKDK